MKQILVMVLCCVAICPRAFAVSCEGLASHQLSNGRITMAVSESAGMVTGLTSEPIDHLPKFCRVAATLMPSSDSVIRIEVWMPIAGWNGKFEGTGNGGYAGSIVYQSLAQGLRRGYAVANTDMGTSRPAGQDADVLIGHPERWRDWGSRSTHEMTVAAKEIIQLFYGKAAAFSYFTGCSTGGQQGLAEAQRFPKDYDGIVAGAPANNRTRLHIGFIWDFAAAEANRGSYLPAAKLSTVSNAALSACVKQKAVATDNFLSNPQACQWDPGAILCATKDGSDCISAEQVTTVREFYEGPRNSDTGASIYPGLARGSELEWALLMPQKGEPIYDALFKWTFGASWDWRTFDFNRDVSIVESTLGPMVNATDANLQPFKKLGHKLIVYHGWADAIVPSLESLNYYRSVEQAQAEEAARHGHSEVEETQGFYRLFMVPGMAHCGSGPGLDELDSTASLESLEVWVEQGIAPGKMIAKRVEKGVTTMTRPVCPYPQIARYDGVGDPHDEASFSCSNPTPQHRK